MLTHAPGCGFANVSSSGPVASAVLRWNVCPSSKVAVSIVLDIVWRVHAVAVTVRLLVTEGLDYGLLSDPIEVRDPLSSGRQVRDFFLACLFFGARL
jgi:hypothetical protein